MKKIYSTIIFLMLLITMIIPSDIFAGEAIGGDPSAIPACEDYDWCYLISGYRFSLYRYKNKNLTYYKSLDYANKVGLYNYGEYNATDNMYGKVAYQKEKASITWSEKVVPIEKSEQFTISYNNSDSSTINTLKGEIRNYFGFCNSFSEAGNCTEEEEDVNLRIKTKIKEIFNETVDISDLPYLYLTVEPTFLIYKTSGAYYYGTIYELLHLNIDDNISFHGINKELYYNMPRSIYAAAPNASDYNNFVGNDDNSLIGVADPDNLPFEGTYEGAIPNVTWNKDDVSIYYGNLIRQDNKTKIISKTGFGIGVFWLGENVSQETVCTDTCSGKTGDALLSCAEKECDDDSDKAKCMVDCGVDEPAGLKCENAVIPGATTTICPAPAGSTKKSCQVNEYIKEDCSETTNAIYSNDLPTILPPLAGGFNYSIITNGTKVCTLTFDIKKFQFDYAKLKRSNTTSRNFMENLLIKYVNMNNTQSIYFYGFGSDDKATLTVDGKKYELKQSKQLSISSLKLTNGSNKTVYMYGNTSKSKQISETKKYISKNDSTIFELPIMCYELGSGQKFPLSIDNKCILNQKNILIPHYGYYNISDKEEVKTEAHIVKKDSGLDDTNICQYYNNDYDFGCHTVVNGNTVKLTLDNPHNLGGIKRYIDSILCTGTECKMTFSPITSKGKIDAYVEYQGKKVYCPANIDILSCPAKFKSTEILKIKDYCKDYWDKDLNSYKDLNDCITKCSDSETCTEIYKPAEYYEIRNYCNFNWKSDSSKYVSSSDCITKCTSTNTCKSLYKTNETENIKTYCENHFSDDGYLNESACINDCSGYIKKPYFYRPITTVDPFPGRTAGLNWLGFEKYITEEKDETSEYYDSTRLGSKAEYIIKLTPNDIVEIRADTKSNGGLETTIFKYDSVATSDPSIYKSDFIHNTFKNKFSCTNGLGECN